MSFQITEQFFNIFVIGWTFLSLVSLPTVLNLNREIVPKLIPPKKNINPGFILPGLLSIIVFATVFLSGNHAKTEITWIFFSFWIIHFTVKIVFNLINPSHHETQIANTKMLSAIVSINALINGYCLGWLWPAYAVSWMQNMAFISGSLILGLGFLIQITANIRMTPKKNETDALDSGLHKIVFCPGYLGEILQWGGFAMITWNSSAAAAFCWMLATLLAQATSQKHKYLLQFPELPATRKALIPFIF